MAEEQDKLQVMRDRIRELHGQKKISLIDVDKFLEDATESQMQDLLDRFDKDKDSITEQQKADLKKLVDQGKIKLAEGEVFDEYLKKLNKDSARNVIKKAIKPPTAAPPAKKSDIPPEAFSEFEKRDEHQISEMLEGRVVDEYIYSFAVSGKQVEGLSYAGTIDAGKYYSEQMVKKGMKPLEVIDYELMHDEVDGRYRAFVKVRDPTGMVIAGYASQSDKNKVWIDKKHDEYELKDDDKADVKAVSKATRNGIRNCLPIWYMNAYMKAVKDEQRK